MPRLPQKDDFPAEMMVDIIGSTPPSDEVSNVLILLHGLGDNQTEYARLATALKLPSTAYLAIRAPAELPMTDATTDEADRMFHWGDDLIFNAERVGFEPDVGFSRALTMLEDVVERVLVGRCGFVGREILVWGFGQGGSIALRLAGQLEMGREGRPGRELAGVISVCGPWCEPGSTDDKYGPNKSKSTAAPGGARRWSGDDLNEDDDGFDGSFGADGRTVSAPVLVCHGRIPTLITPEAMTVLGEVCEQLELQEWAGAGGAMPQNKAEMLPLMRFFARRLSSRQGVPHGAIEVGRR